jgi:PKD repeat protein
LPVNGATGVSLTPILRSSAFSDPDGDIHSASQWQIRTSTGDYSSPVYDSDASSSLTQIAIPSGILSYNTTYYWRVRHQDHLGGWSSYSSETSFTTVSAPPLQAEFTADRAAVVVGQSIQFTSLSSGGVPPLSYQWDFDNNGTWDSTLDDPSYAYPATGVYTVVLKVTDSATNTDTETKLGYITVYASLQADFTADGTVVVEGQSVQFTSLSSGGVPLVSYQWDFDNNGTWDSTLEDPSYAYPAAGRYTVVLKVTDSATNTDTETKVDYITVTEAPPPNQPPARPSNVSPVDGATGVSLTPTLESSAFSDPDEGDTHAASQWQIRSSAGNYSDPVWDSDRDTANLTSISVPSGELGYNTTYYWRVRYEDNNGAWSSWSVETRFTTEEEAVGVPFWVWVVIGLGAAIILAAGAVFGLRRARMIMSKGLKTMFFT